ncbi:TadE/TadG family type IV pilus assembly protein [Arthrobacter sp. 754]|uniref:TadE/TadG family type IV pilus assembly protein n=1 Tax=Arthrobacter sp. 754 TaxID=3156315 RepID=UPI00339802D1
MTRLPFSKAGSRNTKQEPQRGAATIFVAVLMVALLGVSALAVDVGAMYAEKAQVQNGADATALAIGGDCAKGLNCTAAMAASANRLANENANDASTGVFSVTQPNANTVRVETNAREAGTGADHFSLFFAKVLGMDATGITAAAEVSWGPPGSGSTLPWTVSECVFRKYLTPSQLTELDTSGKFTGDPIPTHILLRYDKNAPDYPGCAVQNGYEPGGFGWLVPNAECSTDIVAGGTVLGQPGNSFPKVGGSDKVCQDVLAGILNEPVLIPLFSSALDGGGDKTKYKLIGFAAFEVTGYRFGGSLEVDDDLAPDCSGECRGLQGYFTRFVTIDEGTVAASGSFNFGATKVHLTK